MKHLGRPCQALSRKRVVAGLLASEPRVGGLAVLAKVSALVEATRPCWRAVLVTALCLVTTSEVVYLAIPRTAPAPSSVRARVGGWTVLVSGSACWPACGVFAGLWAWRRRREGRAGAVVLASEASVGGLAVLAR